MNRLMGLDFGSKTVGVAVSDPLGITAQAVETISRTSESKLRRTLARIEELAEQYQVEKIILGYPVHMNGDEGERARKTREFGDMVAKRTGLPVEFRDERLSTVWADRTLKESRVRREHRKEFVDQVAAVMILQGYLDSKTE